MKVFLKNIWLISGEVSQTLKLSGEYVSVVSRRLQLSLKFKVVVRIKINAVSMETK